MSEPVSARPSRAWLGLLVWAVLYALAAAWLVRGVNPNRLGSPYGWEGMLQGVLAGSDTLTHDYPAYWWGWSQIRGTGQIPLWNPSWFCGLPFIASQTFMPFYPGNWFGALLHFPLAFNIQYPLHLWLAAMVMLLCLRTRGLGWWAAGVGGLAWGFGGHLATLAGPGHIQKLQTLAWLPLVTLGLRECAATLFDPTRTRRAIALLTTGLALEITAGHPQILYFSLAAGCCEALAVIIFNRRRLRTHVSDSYQQNSEFPIDPSLEFTLSQDASEFIPAGEAKPTSHGFNFLRTSTLALILPLGLSAIFWIPSAEFARLSNRETTLAWEDATRGSLPPEEAFEFALPRLRGDSMPQGRLTYLGRYGESITSSPQRIVSDYAGAVTLALAAFALFAGGPRRRAAAGFLTFGAAVLLLSFGKYVPAFYRTAMLVIPGLSHLRSPSTMLALLAYGLANAAALGAESLLAPTRPQLGRSLPWRLRIYGPLLLFVSLVFISMQLALAPPPAMPLAAMLPAIKTATLRNAALHQVLPPALAALGLIILFNLAWFFSVSAPFKQTLKWIALLALPLIATHDLIANARPFWNAEPVAPYQQFLTTFWPLEQWAQQDAPIRYYEYGNELTNRALTLSDFPALRSVGTLHGYHPVGYANYFKLLSALGFSTEHPNPNLFRLFAINYLLWPETGGPPVPSGFVEIARAQGKRLLYNPEITYVRPVVHRRGIPDWPAFLASITIPNFNIYEASMVFDDALPAEQRGKGFPLLPLHLGTRVFTPAPGEIQINCTVGLKGAPIGSIIVSEPAVPGWRVYERAGGTPGNDKWLYAPYMPQTIDGFFLTITVVPGTTQVLLHYDPPSQRLGLYLTCLTLAALAFALTQGFTLRRERTLQL